MKVVYILGYSRSGTTLTEALLTVKGYGIGLGEVKYAYERGMLKSEPCSCGKQIDACPVWQSFWTESQTIPKNQLSKIVRQIDQWESTRRFFANLFYARSTCGKRSLFDYQDYQGKLEHALSISGIAQYIDSSKMPSRLWWMRHRINAADISVIFVTRDPRAVAWSCQRKIHRFGPGSELMPRFGYFKAILKWSLNTFICFSVLKFSSLRYIHLRYEDLMEDPQKAIENMELFLLNRSVQRNNQLFHSISGNPSRFTDGFRKIKPDYEWINALSNFKKITGWLICSPMALILRYPICGKKRIHPVKKYNEAPK